MQKMFFDNNSLWESFFFFFIKVRIYTVFGLFKKTGSTGQKKPVLVLPVLEKNRFEALEGTFFKKEKKEERPHS